MEIPLHLQLRGNYPVSIDPKWRLPLPSGIRTDLMNLLAWQQGQAGGSIIGSAGGENATTNTAQDEKKDADESPTTLFLTVTLSQRLGIFTPAGFQEYQRRLDNLPPLDADTETILAQVDGLTYKMPVDKQFRVRLPIELCQATGLEKGQQVTVVGRRSYLEVWDKALWEKSSREAIKTFPQLLKNLRSS
ncbi:MAG: hypothetical protein Kow0059_14470 [Candidatus Sumerlaeia bacterium]